MTMPKLSINKLWESLTITWPVILAFVGGALWANKQFTLLQLSMSANWTIEDQMDFESGLRQHNPNIVTPDAAEIHRRNHPRPQLFNSLNKDDAVLAVKP